MDRAQDVFAGGDSREADAAIIELGDAADNDAKGDVVGGGCNRAESDRSRFEWNSAIAADGLEKFSSGVRRGDGEADFRSGIDRRSTIEDPGQAEPRKLNRRVRSGIAREEQVEIAGGGVHGDRVTIEERSRSPRNLRGGGTDEIGIVESEEHGRHRVSVLLHCVVIDAD